MALAWKNRHSHETSACTLSSPAVPALQVGTSACAGASVAVPKNAKRPIVPARAVGLAFTPDMGAGDVTPPAVRR